MGSQRVLMLGSMGKRTVAAFASVLLGLGFLTPAPASAGIAWDVWVGCYDVDNMGYGRLEYGSTTIAAPRAETHTATITLSGAGPWIVYTQRCSTSVATGTGAIDPTTFTYGPDVIKVFTVTGNATLSIATNNASYANFALTFSTNIVPPCSPSAAVALVRDATNVTNTAARLTASVDANGLATTASFRYASDTETLIAGGGTKIRASVDNPLLETATLTAPECAGAMAEVHADISGLKPSTAYYFVADASNTKGGSSTLFSSAPTAQHREQFGHAINVFATTQVANVGKVTITAADSQTVTFSVSVNAGGSIAGALAVVAPDSATAALWAKAWAPLWWGFSSRAARELGAADTRTTWGAGTAPTLLDQWAFGYTAGMRAILPGLARLQVVPLDFVRGADTQTLTATVHVQTFPSAVVQVVAVKQVDTVTAGSAVVTAGGEAPTLQNFGTTGAIGVAGGVRFGYSDLSIRTKGGIAVADGRLYVGRDNEVAIYEAKTLRSVDVIRGIDGEVRSLTVAGGKLYVVRTGSTLVNTTVDVFELSSKRLLASIPAGELASAPVAYGDRVYVPIMGTTQQPDNRVLVIGLSSNTLLRTILVGQFPSAAAAFEGKLFVTNFGSGTVSVLDPLASDAVSSTLSVQHDPGQAVVVGGRLFIGSQGGTVLSVIDARTPWRVSNVYVLGDSYGLYSAFDTLLVETGIFVGESGAAAVDPATGAYMATSSELFTWHLAPGFWATDGTTTFVQSGNTLLTPELKRF